MKMSGLSFSGMQSPATLERMCPVVVGGVGFLY